MRTFVPLFLKKTRVEDIFFENNESLVRSIQKTSNLRRITDPMSTYTTHPAKKAPKGPFTLVPFSALINYLLRKILK